ncbi:MAG: methylmalonyl-CoA mutase family protein, partial [Chitinophagales bacterium]
PDTEYIPEPHIHAITSKINLTNTDSYNNLLRTTTEAMSAILGGCDILSIHPYDANAEHPDSKAERLALNIQHLLRYESGFDAYRQIADGAYYIESLTTTIAEKAWKHFLEITEAGGFVVCLEKGIISNEIYSAREKVIRAFNSGKNKIIGVNAYGKKSEELENKPYAIPEASTPIRPIVPFRLNT